MSIHFKLQDEVFGGAPARDVRNPLELTLVSETLKAKEIICERARQRFRELADDGSVRSDNRLDLAYWLSRKTTLPASEEEAVAEAVRAFERHEFFFFWNDEQIFDPDQRLQVLGDNIARFIQLIPLKGG
ncbi:MAG: hypothetical protein AAGF59_04955 [Pseudomonadota bacterium]